MEELGIGGLDHNFVPTLNPDGTNPWDGVYASLRELVVQAYSVRIMCGGGWGGLGEFEENQ